MSKIFIVTESEKSQIRKMYLTETFYPKWTKQQLEKLVNKIIYVYEVRPGNTDESNQKIPYKILSANYIENGQFLLSCKPFMEGKERVKVFQNKEFIYTCHKYLKESEGKTVIDEATLYSAIFSDGNVSLDDNSNISYKNLTEYLKGICEYNEK